MIGLSPPARRIRSPIGLRTRHMAAMQIATIARPRISATASLTATSAPVAAYVCRSAIPRPAIAATAVTVRVSVAAVTSSSGSRRSAGRDGASRKSASANTIRVTTIAPRSPSSSILRVSCPCQNAKNSASPTAPNTST